MSVRKSCYTCKHYKHGLCSSWGMKICGDDLSGWELSDDAKADLLHDAEPEHDNQLRESKRKTGQFQSAFIEQIKDKCKVFDRRMRDDLFEVVSLIEKLDYEEDINKSVDMAAKCFHVDREILMSFVIDSKKNKSNRGSIASGIFKFFNEPKKEKPEHDAVNHPSHYTAGGIECIDCIKAALGENFIGFLIGNVFKYCYRYRNKNGLEDLKKAAWYLDRAIKEINDEAK